MTCKVLDILEFLEYYQQYPCLWDKSSPYYKNRQMRDDAERALMGLSGIADVKILRAKIRSIRGTYNNEIRKLNKSTKYAPKLYWFNYANSFLSKNIVTNTDDDPDSETNLDMSSESQHDDHDYRSKGEENTSKPYIILSDPPTVCSTLTTGNNKSPRFRHINPPNRTPLLKCQRHLASNITRKPEIVAETNSSINSRVGDAIREVVESLKHPTDNVTSNEFLAFGQSVGVQLSKLPIPAALKLQFEIQTLITNARLREFTDNKSAHSRPDPSHSDTETPHDSSA